MKAYGVEVSHQAEVAVSALAPRLTVLKSLDLEGLHEAMSYRPLQQHVMYGTLASMPCLESLVLPGCRSLECIGPLAGSSCLRSLAIEDDKFVNERDMGEIAPSRSLSHQALAGIATLQRLPQFTLQSCIFSCGVEGVADAGLVELLASLPPSVEELNVGAVVPPAWDDEDKPGPRVEASLQRGSVRSLKLSCLGDAITAHHVFVLVEVLLGWPALGPELERLELSALVLNDSDELRLPPLLELFGRCRQTKLQTLVLGLQASVGGVQRLLQLLPQVNTVEVELMDGGRAYNARLWQRADQQPGQPLPAGDPAAASPADPAADLSTAVGNQQPSTGPNPVQLLNVALCSTAGIAAAVVAAATAAATAAAARLATAGVEAPVPGALLKVVALSSTYHSTMTNLMGRVSEVAQEMLGGRHGAEGWGEQERVRCALQLWILLRELPDEV
ncbi:hypothetical protein TSOC_009250 [Tetrabaena socialis]|uniref:Uncharacterized protein n=1 Tax=Tetrabaena socialis TaxID=47790 RepID=A0A2J7ZWE5_9CHLO|nr:hypothetical protein TSOC_009250 [Tetrabaena socialis]|eukprot:PNH04597.1 hypothetical protein TSOC_009250 [Tetrabaena socialis]